MNLFLFHRDLRLIDNTALIKQIKRFGQVTPIFIFHGPQIEPKQNKYFSNNSVQFMVESLKELSLQIRKRDGLLYYFKGDNIDVLNEISQKIKIKSIGYNLDYTPFAKKRDQEIKEWAAGKKVQVIEAEDYGMYDHLKGQTLNEKSGKPYLVFTPFKKFCMNNFTVPKPDPFDGFSFQNQDQLLTLEPYFEDIESLYKYTPTVVAKGGRSNALITLSKMKSFKNYNKTRNIPTIPTTRLSAHLHFTTVSIREVYHCALDALGLENNLISEIHWREFYMYITHHFPKVLSGKSFQQKFDVIKWKTNEKYLEAWKTGNTGFPIVDAAMRELNTTGYMHNRCRMITASFFAKDMFLDWHEGERYFASQLVDYSPMQNSGGWQWTAGNGTDASPYFRIFNPWTQQKTHDPECQYIKKWIPELKSVGNKDIHQWEKTSKFYHKKGVEYPAPILDHDEARHRTLDAYKQYFKS